MKTDNGIYRHDVEIRESTEFTGLVMGTMRAHPGVLLVLRGSVAKDLHLGEGTRLELYGQVGGDIINRGGLIVHNSGTVGGVIQ